MAARTLPYNLSLRDAKGWMGVMRFHITGDTITNTLVDYESAADTLQVAIEGLSNAAFQRESGIAGTGSVTLAYGTNAQYTAEWMKAVMTFTTDTPSISRFKVPAPKIAIFDTDGITVKNDGSVAVVVAFINAVKNADASGTFVSTADGKAFTHFVGGILRLGKQPRRFNEFIKSSGLVAGEGE